MPTPSVDVPAVRDEVLRFLLDVENERGPFTFDMYLLVDRGEVQERSASVQLPGYSRGPRQAPTLEDPDFALRNRIWRPVANLVWPIVEEREKTRVIIHYEGRALSFVVSE